jgi:hypothetical protein
MEWSLPTVRAITNQRQVGDSQLMPWGRLDPLH